MRRLAPKLLRLYIDRMAAGSLFAAPPRSQEIVTALARRKKKLLRRRLDLDNEEAKSCSNVS
jgi:hypothetical protein